MKKLFLSIVLLSASAVTFAQKSEVAEAKKKWDIYELTLAGPEPKREGGQRPPGGAPIQRRQTGMSSNMGGSSDGRARVTEGNTREKLTLAQTGALSTSGGRVVEAPKKVASNYVEKQLLAISAGMEHTDKAIAHEKTKNLAEPWVYRALFAASAAHVDTLNIANSIKFQETAMEALTKAKSLSPTKDDSEKIASAELILNNAMRTRAIVAYNRKDFQAAYGEFAKLSAMNPQDTAMYGNVAYMAKETKNYPAAIENYKKAIAMNSPESNAYYSEIFRINMEQKDTTAAIATLQQASAKYPDEAFFISNEADIYYRQGNVVKADALLDKLLAKDPKNPAYIRIKADTYFNQAFEAQETVRKLEDAKKYKEADAMLKKKSDMLGKALPLYLSLETMDPKNSEVVRMIKQVYFGLGNNEKTEEYSKKEKSLEGN